MQLLPLTALLVFGCTAVAHGLPQAPFIDWEVSVDGGMTWTSEATIVHPQTIKIRSSLRWSGDGLGVKFVNFDAWISGVMSTGSPSNIVRAIVPPGDTQQIVFTRLSEFDGKVDVQGDTAAPGNGPQWIRMGQDSPENLGAAFNTANPIELMSYDFAVAPGTDWRYFEFGSVQSSVNLQSVQIYDTPRGVTIGGAFSRQNVGMNSCRLRFRPLAYPPTITIHQQPMTQSVCFGHSATFTVVATTTAPPLQYVWSYPDDITVSINGSSISSNGLWEPFPFWFAGGQFVCYITDAAGTVVSETAHLLYNRADQDMNGWIDIEDYYFFLNDFSAGTEAGDWNRDQEIDLFDYLDFLEQYVSGC